MTFILLIIIVLVGLSVVVFQILWTVLLIHQAVRGTEVLATPRRQVHIIIDILRNVKATPTVIYDLGCGKGGVTCAIKYAFPAARVIGIDNDQIQIFCARSRAFFLRQPIIFRRANFLDLSLADATCIYAFLPLTLLPVIGAKLRQELKIGAIVITNAKQFPQWSPPKPVGNFFVYQR